MSSQNLNGDRQIYYVIRGYGVLNNDYDQRYL